MVSDTPQLDPVIPGSVVDEEWKQNNLSNFIPDYRVTSIGYSYRLNKPANGCISRTGITPIESPVGLIAPVAVGIQYISRGTAISIITACAGHLNAKKKAPTKGLFNKS